MHRPVFLLLLALVPAVASCTRPAREGAAAAGADTLPAATQAAAEHAGGDGTAAHAALRLRPIMQKLDNDMAALSHGLWMEDYVEIAARAAAVADHPHVAPEEMQRIQGILGPEMSRFVAADQTVHDAAVRLRGTAEATRMDGVLQHLGEVQAGCISCHTQFRERLRTDRP
jgi:hypothetical protein